MAFKQLLFKAFLVFVLCIAYDFSYAQSIKSKGTVLVILSSTDSVQLKDGRKLPTGLFLNELFIPVQALMDAGYKIEIANPKGNKPAVAELSNSVNWFNGDTAEFHKAQHFVDTYPGMQHPKRFRDIVAANAMKKYVAVFTPGGLPPINDLMQDVNLGKILRYFHAASKPSAFICHGPVATLSTLADPVAYRAALVSDDPAAIARAGKNWIYAGYRMTIYCNEEDQVAEQNILKGRLPLYVADALSKAGGRVEKADKNFAPLVVRDRELLTGENPASDHALVDELIKILAETK